MLKMFKLYLLDLDMLDPELHQSGFFFFWIGLSLILSLSWSDHLNNLDSGEKQFDK